MCMCISWLYQGELTEKEDWIMLWVQGMQEEPRTSKANTSAQIFWGKWCCICLKKLVGCCFAFLCQGSIPYTFPFTGCCVHGVLGCQDIWFLGDLACRDLFTVLGMHRDFYYAQAQQECRVLTQEQYFLCPLGTVSGNPCDCLKDAKCRTVTLFCALCTSISLLSCWLPTQIFSFSFFVSSNFKVPQRFMAKWEVSVGQAEDILLGGPEDQKCSQNSSELDSEKEVQLEYYANGPGAERDRQLNGCFKSLAFDSRHPASEKGKLHIKPHVKKSSDSRKRTRVKKSGGHLILGSSSRAV